MRDRLLHAACALPAGRAALVAACLAAIPAAPAYASVSLEVRVISGVQAPGSAPGMILDGFGNAVVNDAGEVAFLGFIHDPLLEIGGPALFGPDAAGELTEIVTGFEQVPDLPPGTELRLNNTTYYPRLNDAGQVTFSAGLSGPGIQFPSDASGIWRWSAEMGLDLLARAGDAVPDAGPGLVLGAIPGFLTLPAIGAGGVVGFMGTIGDPIGFTSDTALFSIDAGGTSSLLVIPGTPVPGVPGAELTFMGNALMNAPGRFILHALFEGPGVVEENDYACFRWDPQGGLSMLLRAGDPAPGMPGVAIAWPDACYPNDADDVAYLTWLAGPGVDEGNDSALYGTAASGVLDLLAREGHPAPGTEPGTVFQDLHVSNSGVVINTAGRVAFTAGVAGPAVTPANAYGIWLSDPTTGAFDLLVRQGDPAPELPELTLAGPGAPMLNDRGDLVFSSTLEGPGVTPETDYAVFAIEGGGAARKVVREGDLVEFGPGDLRPLTFFSMLAGTLSDVPGVGQLSDNGHLVFAANALDGTNAIVVATLPEPGTGTGVMAGVVLLAWLRRHPRALR